LSKDVQKALILDVRTTEARAAATSETLTMFAVETELFPQQSSSHGLGGNPGEGLGSNFGV